MAGTGAMNEVSEWVQARSARLERELFDWLRIPSVSSDPERAERMVEAVDWLCAKLASLGFEVELWREEGSPPILLASRRGRAGAPTVLIYGHYDVQPAEPLERWDTHPFDPVIREGRVIARGATDDKGQLHLQLAAIEALLSLDGELPVNVRFVVEGEEEVGSTALLQGLEARAEELACDAVVISDMEMLGPGSPAVEIGFRGILGARLTVTGPAEDLHSGLYGGAVMNPAVALCEILAALRGRDGRVRIEGFYDDVRTFSVEERSELGELPFDEDAFLEATGVEDGAGEAGFSTLERIWCRPAFDVHSLEVAGPAEGAKTAIPAAASALLSFRLVPRQSTRAVAEQLRRRVAAATPGGVRSSVEITARAEPWETGRAEPLLEIARQALEEAFGSPAELVRGGGSLPIVSLFDRCLGAPVLLIGFGLPGSNPHGPNEWLDLDTYRRGIGALVTLYRKIGSSAAKSREGGRP